MRPASILKAASKPGDPVIHQLRENNVQRRVPAREGGLKGWGGEKRGNEPCGHVFIAQCRETAPCCAHHWPEDEFTAVLRSISVARLAWEIMWGSLSQLLCCQDLSVWLCPTPVHPYREHVLVWQHSSATVDWGSKLTTPWLYWYKTFMLLSPSNPLPQFIMHSLFKEFPVYPYLYNHNMIKGNDFWQSRNTNIPDFKENFFFF